MPLPVTDRSALVEHLTALGLKRGMGVVVHARLLSFGDVPGGEATVYAALRDVLGDEGAIVVPTFTLWLEEGAVYDRRVTPSQRMGSFAEYVRTLPGAVRSRCPMHNFAGVGPAAQALEKSPGVVSLGAGSDFEALSDAGFQLLFLGCNFKDAATYTMHVEALVGVPFRRWLDLPRFVAGPQGEAEPLTCRYYGREAMDRQENLQVVEDLMTATGCVRREPCPFGHSYFMSIADFQTHVSRLFRDDPWATLRDRLPADA